MSSPKFPPKIYKSTSTLTPTELKSLLEDIMNTPKLPSIAQKLATARLLESNKQAARDMLLRMQLGLKPQGSK